MYSLHDMNKQCCCGLHARGPTNTTCIVYVLAVNNDQTKAADSSSAETNLHTDQPGAHQLHISHQPSGSDQQYQAGDNAQNHCMEMHLQPSHSYEPAAAYSAHTPSVSAAAPAAARAGAPAPAPRAVTPLIEQKAKHIAAEEMAR